MDPAGRALLIGPERARDASVDILEPPDAGNALLQVQGVVVGVPGHPEEDAVVVVERGRAARNAPMATPAAVSAAPKKVSTT